MSKIEVNTIEPQCGTTLTLGASGDTVTLASGASQSGFGRTGTVDWQTGSIKTTTFTGENGKGYFVNTTSGAVTANLPASPTAGDIMAVSDYAQTSNTNNITIGRNGSNIQGDASDLVIKRDGVALTLVFVDSTKGWVVTDSGAEADKEPSPEYIVATGGTITCCGNFKIHTFTGPGTFTVCSAGNPLGSNTVDYLVIAGGGGGGSPQGGGGGAGGYRESSGAASGCYTRSPLGACVSALPVTAQGYPITVGSGGTGTPPSGPVSANGGTSTFSTISSAGGGAGTFNCQTRPSGGSGSGAPGGGSAGYPRSGGAGNTPPVSPPQGNDGGACPANFSPQRSGGGGGGATTAGAASASNCGGNGGTGATSSINGTPTQRAGGGGGGTQCGSGSAGTATGGGGAGGVAAGAVTAGTANTGGGGGGGGPGITGANGGSGIVIIRYKFQN